MVISVMHLSIYQTNMILHDLKQHGCLMPIGDLIEWISSEDFLRVCKENGIEL